MWFTWPKGSSSPAPGREILLSAELLAMAEGLLLLSFISEAWLLAMQLHSACSLWLSVVPFRTVTNLAATLPKLLLCSFCSNQDWKMASDVLSWRAGFVDAQVSGHPHLLAQGQPWVWARQPLPLAFVQSYGHWYLRRGFLSSAVMYTEYST